MAAGSDWTGDEDSDAREPWRHGHQPDYPIPGESSATTDFHVQSPGLAESPRPGDRIVSLQDRRPAFGDEAALDRSGHPLGGPSGLLSRPSEVTHVLVVEHDEDDFLITRELLERAEQATYRIEWANGAESGLRRLAAGGFDICLVDYRLPGRTGLDLIQVAQNRGFEQPMILMSAMAEPDVDLAAIDLGVEDFIDKEEIDVDRLDRSIRFALARRRAISRFGHLAQYDELTGLCSRAVFRARLRAALSSARRRMTRTALLLISLNNLKEVNEALGCKTGDKLLTVMAERLRARLRETDTVARLGGNQFAVIAEDLAKPAFAGIVARKLLDTLSPPVAIDDVTIDMTFSIGAVLYPDDGQAQEDLVHLASASLYEAKREGGNRCRFRDPDFDKRLRHGALIGQDLRDAIEANELRLDYQPQITLASPEIGLSAIIHWQHPEHGLIEADGFRTMAEENSLMEPLVSWLLDQACAQAREWHLAGLGPLHISLPVLSRRQLSWTDLANRITAVLNRHELPPSWIELEMDEELLLDELQHGGQAFQALRKSGIRLAVGRYGSGPTSLALLRDAPITTVRLAKEVLENCPQDEHAKAFAASIIALCKKLSLRVVAHGAETQAQLQMLRAQACDAVQAALSCPPLPSDACTNWLHQASVRMSKSRQD